MKAKSHNYIVLDGYFKKLISDNSEIPFITHVSQETSVSPSTITRYAKCKGYYGYPDMRSALLKQLKQSDSETKTYSSEAIKLIDFLHNNEKIVIYSSMSSRPVGAFLSDRLKTIKQDVALLEDLSAFTTIDRGVIALTVSGQSARIEKLLKDKRKYKEVLLITCSTEDISHNNAIILSEYMYHTRTNNELFRSLRQVNDWIQSVLDEYDKI